MIKKYILLLLTLALCCGGVGCIPSRTILIHIEENGQPVEHGYIESFNDISFNYSKKDSAVLIRNGQSYKGLWVPLGKGSLYLEIGVHNDNTTKLYRCVENITSDAYELEIQLND